MKKTILDGATFFAMASFASAPVFAGQVGPAPVAGVGMVALAVLGFGYRALRKRIDG